MNAFPDFDNALPLEDVHLTNEDRARARKAITSHPDWPDYRARTGYTAADLTTARCNEAARALGIDLRAVLAGTETPDPTETRPVTKTPPAAPKATGDDAAALATIRQLLGASVDAAQVKAIVDEALAPVLESIGRPALRVIDGDGNRLGRDLPPTRHPKTDTLLSAVSARDASGHRLNVWIAGPAGSGKTYAARSIAEALGLDFAFHGAMTMTHELTGFVDAGGTYHATPFVRLFEAGGVCLLDEVDAGSSEALLALNAALANGMMTLPDGRQIARHADFVCIAAANTWGGGATADYVGRARIDAAFLDRFGARIAWDYDDKLEREMCGNPDWARRVQKARKAAQKAGLKVVISPRASMAGAALVAGGMTEDEAAALTYLANLSPEQVAMIEGRAV